MFIKITGGALLLMSSTAAGIIKAHELSLRVKTLNALSDSLIAFENEIRYRLAPMYDALMSAAACDVSGIFCRAAESLFSFGAANAMKRAVGTSTLQGEEKASLLSFAAGLSAEDAEGQIKNARVCRERLLKALKSAEDKKARLYKLYCVSGGISGMAVLLLII